MDDSRREYDAVVIGSGPNGLAAAIAIAQRGGSVLVLESRDTPGGGARTAELTLPGFHHDVCSAVHPTAAASPFFQSLPLAEHGLEFVHPQIPLAHPLDGGECAVMHQSLDETAAALGEDGRAYQKLFRPLLAGADPLFEQLLAPPLRVPKNLLAMARFGLKAMRSASGIATSYFNSEHARALFAGNAAHSFMPLRSPFTAAIGLVIMLSGHRYGWPVAKGGSGNITTALCSLLESLGGKIECGRTVACIDELPSASAYLFDTSPKALADIAGSRLPQRYLKALGGFRHGPGIFKIDYALSEPIPWTAAPCRKAGTVHVGGTLREIEDAERATWQNFHHRAPFILVAQQSLCDPSRAPKGKHTAWAYAHVPAGSEIDMTGAIENQIGRFAPGFRDCILARHTMACSDVETYNANNIGGDIAGGANSWRQVFMRPVARLTPYTTPAKDIFICSASTPPAAAYTACAATTPQRQPLNESQPDPMRKAILVISLSICGFATAKDIPVVIQHTFGDQPLRADSLRYKNDAGETLSFTRVSYLLSGFEIRRDGRSWQALPEQYAWLDVAKRRTQFKLTGVPNRRFDAIRFRIGLPAATNAAEPEYLLPDHPLNPNLNGLHWSWQGGYIFLAVEGHFRAPNSRTLSGYSYHFANDPNRTAVTVDLAGETRVIPLRFDLQKVLAPIDIGALGTSTHSRAGDAIAALIKRNLPSAWSLQRSEKKPPVREQKSRPRAKYPPRGQELYRFNFDPKFSFPNLPTDNPMTVVGVELGRKLFHERRLSRNNSISCASCHQEKHAFADPRQFSLGVDQKVGSRNSMPLLNLAWKDSFFWDGRASSLREQVLHPIQDPLEMDQSLEATIAKLGASDEYPALFEKAFGVPGIDTERLTLALEQFLLSLTSYRSKFDLAARGKTELTAQEKRGFELFFTEYDPRTEQFGADCFHCHGGPMFTNHGFANNGLDERFTDGGRGAITKKQSDQGKFSVPSLRNVALTAPYMHDGRFETLAEVVDHYGRGLKRSATVDPNLAKHPREGLGLSDADKRALIAFLESLTEVPEEEQEP